MTTLILDTSGAHTLIALSKQGELIDSSVYPHQNKLSSLLTCSIQTILKKHDLSPKDLVSVCIGIGPGSYTGTRVGAAVAKSFCLALEIPLLPFCSLLAYVPEFIEGPFVFFMEAKQGNPFLLEANATSAGFSFVSWRFSTSPRDIDTNCKPISHLALDKEKFYKAHPSYDAIALQQAEICLKRLSSYLHSESLQGKARPFSELGTLELLYLHTIALQPVTAEVLLDAGS